MEAMLSQWPCQVHKYRLHKVSPQSVHSRLRGRINININWNWKSTNFLPRRKVPNEEVNDFLGVFAIDQISTERASCVQIIANGKGFGSTVMIWIGRFERMWMVKSARYAETETGNWNSNWSWQEGLPCSWSTNIKSHQSPGFWSILDELWRFSLSSAWISMYPNVVLAELNPGPELNIDFVWYITVTSHISTAKR